MDISISVAIPTYNASEFLRKAIESVLAQTYPASEIVVVDDGSTDDTREVCESFDTRVKYIYQDNDTTLGAGARAHAMRETTGNWIALLDHDDLWETDKLEKQVAALRLHPDAGVVFTRFHNVDETGRPFGEEPLVTGQLIRMESHDAFHHLLNENFYAPSTALVSGDFFRKFGVCDPMKVGCADWDLWLSISRELPILVVDEVLTGYRSSPGQFCSDKSKLAKALQITLEAQRKHLSPNCTECTRSFEVGRSHVAMVFGVAARTHLDRFHERALAGKPGEALSSLRAAYKNSRGEVLRPARLAAISKNGLVGTFKGLKGASH